jgi:hypothetical protein
MCKLDRVLRNSHIVPEFLYKPVYEEKHRTRLFRYGDTRDKLIQKGLRERLLCSDCEQHIQEFEDYFARYWYQTRPIPERITNDELLLRGIDYRRFKLFVLSVVWRASVSRLPELSSTGLGPHEVPIRRMILEGDPGTRDDYPIYAGLIIDPETQGLWDQVIMVPLRIRVGPHWACRSVFGGASWTVLTSSHQTLPLHGHFLTETGELRLTRMLWQDFARVSGLVEATARLKTRRVG